MNDNDFNDPLADFDPVMESAFSVNEPPSETPPPSDDPTPIIDESNVLKDPEPTVEQQDSDQISLESEQSFLIPMNHLISMKVYLKKKKMNKVSVYQKLNLILQNLRLMKPNLMIKIYSKI